jgi:tRNA (mo5U34)-methyltransferase
MTQAPGEPFSAEVSRFVDRVRALGLGDVGSYQWYHAVDLGDGLITPGLCDYRETVAQFGFDEDLSGKRVLDVGSATGFFTFFFERRGALVTSVELPSLDAIDRFPGQDPSHVVRRILEMRFGPGAPAHGETAESLYRNLLFEPFRFCQKRLDSKAQRKYLSIYDLSLARLGTEDGYDLVFAGDVIWHTLNPLAALGAAASVCRGTLVLVQYMPELPDGIPAMVYQGGSALTADDLHWLAPTKECFIQVLHKLGFERVIEHGKHRGIHRASGHAFERTILHASR